MKDSTETSDKPAEKPPANSQMIWGVKGLSSGREPREYEIHDNDGGVRLITLSKRIRQVLDTLMRGPVHCASPVRISDMVYLLREDYGLDIETKMYPGDPATGAGTYGVYFLRSDVRVIDRELAA